MKSTRIVALIAIFVLSVIGQVRGQVPIYEMVNMGYFEGEYQLVYGPRHGDFVELVDLESDGINDVFYNGPGVLWNLGSNSQPDYKFLEYSYGSHQNHLCDLNNDLIADIIWDYYFTVEIGCAYFSVGTKINAGDILNPNWSTAGRLLKSGNTNVFIQANYGDINGDGFPDIAIGDQFYINNGNENNPDFFVDSTIVVEATPGDPLVLCDIDGDGDLDLFYSTCYHEPWITSEIRFFRNAGTPAIPEFILETENYAGIELDDETTIEFSDFDYDDDYDMTLDEVYYENIGTADSASFVLADSNVLSPFPADLVLRPIFGDLDGDGDLDFIPFRQNVDDSTCRLVLYENAGSADDADWRFLNDSLVVIENCSMIHDYSFTDIDADGDLDLLVIGQNPSNDGFNSLFRNTGSSQNPEFVRETDDLWESWGTDFVVVDADLDNDYDIIDYTYSIGNLRLFENTGTAQAPDFQLTNDNYLNYSYMSDYYLYYTVADFDADNDLDVYADYCYIDGYGDYYEGQDFFRNDGTAANPVWNMFEDFEIEGIMPGYKLWGAKVYDIDNDGYLDMFAGAGTLQQNPQTDLILYRGLQHWGEVGGEMSANQLLAFSLSPVYPNPFNGQAVIPFSLERAGRVELMIYDITGREVGVQYIEPLQAGQHEAVWNAEGCASGVYFVTLKQQSSGTLLHTQTRKVVLVK